MAQAAWYRFISEGGLFYDNLGDVGYTDFWDWLASDAYRRFATQAFEKSEGHSRRVGQSFEEIGLLLQEQGMEELKHEVKVLNEMYGMNLDASVLLNEGSFLDLIKAFNEAVNIKDMFQQTLKLINGKLVTSTGKIYDEKSLLDSAARIFGSYMNSYLRDSAREQDWMQLLTDFAFSNESSFNAKLRDMAEAAMNHAFEALRVADTPTDEQGVVEHAFTEMIEGADKIQNFRQKFHQEFYSRFGFDKLYEKLQEAKKQNSNLRKLGDFVDFANKKINGSVLGGGLKSASTAGYIQEYMATAIYTAMSKNLKKKDYKYVSFTVGSVGGKVSNTDIVSVITKSSQNVELMMSESLEASQALNGVNKTGVREGFQEFTNKLKKIEDYAVIYESTKEYNLGTLEKYHEEGIEGTSYDRTQAINLFNSLGYYRADYFINAIMNTAPGTLFGSILGSHYKPDTLRDRLAVAMGSMLFDNYKISGNPANGIYVFRISNIVVPLSYLLLKAGKAYSAATKDVIKEWINFEITYPERKYTNEYYQKNLPAKQKTKEASIARWEAQVKKDDAEFKIKVQFMKNFVQLLKGDFAALIE